MIRDIHISDDYAVFEADDCVYYYGYEHEENGEWCFVAREGDHIAMIMKTSELEKKMSMAGDLDVASYLIAGMYYYTKLKQLRFLEDIATHHEDDEVAKEAMKILRKVNKTYHWCRDWDDLVISDQHTEFKHCSCKFKSDKKLEHRNKGE